MKRLLLASTSLLLILPDIVLAQQAQTRPAPSRPAGGNPGRPGGGGPSRPGGNGARPTPVRPTPSRPSVRPSFPNSGGGGVRPSRPDGNRPGGRPSRPNPGGSGNRPPRPNPGNGTRPWGPAHRPGSGRPPNFRPVHGPTFRYPHGYRYRRWTIGLLLPALFLSSYYYYDNYYDLGVGAPPPGYRWVRYGPDLLLIQLGTRRVADVIYGAFY